MVRKLLFYSFSIFVATSCQENQPDTFVKIDGKNQHILDWGKGQPAVIFISGFGDDLTVYKDVQSKIAKITRTLSYDRAGLGKSEFVDSARALDQMVWELDEIIGKRNIKQPYVLIGHSYGAHIARYYTKVFSEKVAGILLIDPSPEYLEDELRNIKTEKEMKQYDSLYQHGRDPDWSKGINAEADYFRKNTIKMKACKFPDNIPVTVLTAMNIPESIHDFLKGVNEIKLNLHKKWSDDAPQMNHIISNKSGHYIQRDEPELVIHEVEKLIKKLRDN